VESYPYPVKEGQRYINLNPNRLFVQLPPKRERDRETNYTHKLHTAELQLLLLRQCKLRTTTTTLPATRTTFHWHDIISHPTVLHLQSLLFLSLVHPVQCSQLFQAELLSTGVHLVLAVHWPLISWLIVSMREHGQWRLRIPSVPTSSTSTSISPKLTTNIAQ